MFSIVRCLTLGLQFLTLTALFSTASGHAKGFEDSMAERTRACTACHGDQGRAGPDGYYPRLAGKPAGYLYNQLKNFAQGRRHYGLMTRLVDPLSDAYLRGRWDLVDPQRASELLRAGAPAGFSPRLADLDAKLAQVAATACGLEYLEPLERGEGAAGGHAASPQKQSMSSSRVQPASAGSTVSTVSQRVAWLHDGSGMKRTPGIEASAAW